MSYFRGDHRSQYDPGASTRLRSMGCTPTSGANAVRVQTGGAVDLSGDQVLAKLANSEEQNPATPGWTLGDLSKALSRIAGVPTLFVRSTLWSTLVSTRAAGHVIVLQGDSEEFLGGCSGAFDGDHCIIVHPDNAGTDWLIGDPICLDWTSQPEDIVRRYAQNLWGSLVTYGVFEAPVNAGEQMAAMRPSNPQPTSGEVTTKHEAIAWNAAGDVVTFPAGTTKRTAGTVTFARQPLPGGGYVEGECYVIDYGEVFYIGIYDVDFRPYATGPQPVPQPTPLGPGIYQVG